MAMYRVWIYIEYDIKSLTIWNYVILYMFTIYLKLYQQMLNWLFGHYNTLMNLLDKKNHQ